MPNVREIHSRVKTYFSVVLACDVSYDGDAHFEAEVGTSFANDSGFDFEYFRFSTLSLFSD